ASQDRLPGAAYGVDRLGRHEVEANIPAPIGGAQLSRGRESGSLRPGRGQPVYLGERIDHTAPLVVGVRWVPIDELLHKDAIGVAATVIGGYGSGYAHPMAREVVEQAQFPVERLGRPARSSDYESLVTSPGKQHLVA